MVDVPDSGLPYLVIFIAYSVWFLLFEAWIWYRRNKQPLKARGVVWLTLVDISGYLFLSSICWKEIVGNENFSCAIKALVNNICPPIFFLGYFVRVWKLYFMFQIQGYDISKQDNQQNNRWFFQNKKYARNTFLFIAYIVMALIWVIIAVIELFTVKAYYAKLTNCVASVADVVPIVITSITAIISLFTVTFRLRSVHDGFKMVWELRILTTVWFILGVAYIVIRGILVQGDVPQINILLIILIIITHLVSIVWPLRLTYTPYFYKQFTDTSSQEYDFGSLLSSEQGVQQFKAFIQGEFSVENLLFWDAVTKLENENDDSHRNNMQKSIYELYIKENAPLQVSIPTKLRSNIDVAHNEKSDLLPLFKKAKDRIYTQMQDDSFGRFVMSDQFEAVRPTVFRLDNPADKLKTKTTSDEDIEAVDPFSCCGTSK